MMLWFGVIYAQELYVILLLTLNIPAPDIQMYDKMASVEIKKNLEQWHVIEFWWNQAQKQLIFSEELQSHSGDKILLQAEMQQCTAFKGNLDVEQWLQCSFYHVNNNKGQKFIVDSCPVSVCQNIQDQNVKINSVDVTIQEYFPSLEGLGCPTSCTEISTISSYIFSGAEFEKLSCLEISG